VIRLLICVVEKGSSYALGSVSGVASFITTDDTLHKTVAAIFPMQVMGPEGFDFFSN